MTIKVTLRKKSISGERQSLYLDFYPAIVDAKTGQPTRREFLKMYVHTKAKTAAEKEHNAEQLETAEQIRLNRQNYFNKPEIYQAHEKQMLAEKEKQNQCFVAYFKALIAKKDTGISARWRPALLYMEQYTGGTWKFADINASTVNDLKGYYLKATSIKSNKAKLNHNTASTYFNKVRAALKRAHADGYLKTNVSAAVETIKPRDTRREFVTSAELSALLRTPCTNEVLKRAALFSALTGLRFSDIKNLTWAEVRKSAEGYYLTFRQQKTKGEEIHPISKQSYTLTGGHDNLAQMPREQPVFKGLEYSTQLNRHLHAWISAAGIARKITFHSFRHTYAVLQLEAGTDIYTVSKLLTHRDLKTTQIYAKVQNAAKRRAADKVSID
jgi:integrase